MGNYICYKTFGYGGDVYNTYYRQYQGYKLLTDNLTKIRLFSTAISFNPGLVVRVCGTVKQPNTSSNLHNIYSTEETVIGTWVDGKPIYRKVIIINNPNIGTSTYNIQELNIDELIHSDGNEKNANSNYHIPIMYYINYNQGNWYWINQGILEYTINWEATSIKFTLEYTKTID